MSSLPTVTGYSNIGTREYPHGRVYFKDREVWYTPLIEEYQVWGGPARYIEAARRYLIKKGIRFDGQPQKKEESAGAGKRYAYAGRR